MDWEMEKKEIEWMALKKGRAEGEAKGKAEGLAEGEAKGRAEGKAEGLAENTKTLAAYLKSMDDSLTMEQAICRASEILESKDV